MYKILFIIIALFLIMLAVSKCKFTEGFANTPVAITSDNVADYIYTVYKADVKAIQNLADIAMKLQAGGIIVPGNMTVQNTLTTATLEVKGNSTLDGSLTVKGGLSGDTKISGTTTISGGLTAGATTLGILDATRVHATNNESWLGHEGDNHNYFRGGTFLSGGIIGEGGDFKNALNIDKDGNLRVTGNITCDGMINEARFARFNGDGIWDAGFALYSQNRRWVFTDKGYFFCQGDGGAISILGNGADLAQRCDKRIKENIITANSNDILNKINQLPMQNYNFNDKRYYDGNTVYGLIAQDVKEVFPEAVNITKHHIPNINKDVTSIVADGDTIVLTLEEFTVKVDDDLYLVVNDKPVFVKVLAFTDTTITVNKWKQYNANDKVSVYGTTTDDFHILNASYLGILSLGGIQELTKQNNELKARIEKLEQLLTK
jgi:hypothetical protein